MIFHRPQKIKQSDHEGENDGFTKKYDVKHLVYYEMYAKPIEAIQREKRMKKWRRQWKINLIEESNPNWNDLYFQLTEGDEDSVTNTE
ncbi:hypothetical protein COY07_00545 [Candidatus Peregrinibacteria bacterium CG_4_10_14_0_2_um_filter_43_11]|nr:MAG: hypothetical protein COY07_00545 [Candidatus Peregrinibacteria bacterium CG_4_10_14_0_2_um_filter_43_11]